jgi:hypothetical protein
MNHEELNNENLNKNLEQRGMSRRGFLHGIGGAGAFLSMGGMVSDAAAPKDADGKVIPGFEKTKDDPNAAKGWRSVSDRKVRVGIAGYGLCKFGGAFFYQNHPNIEVVAATDLDPGRCAALAKAVGAKKTYSSCEEMIKDKSIEAIYIATDAPSHARLAIMALNHGKHVVSAVPAVFGFEAEGQAEELFNAVKKSGMKYMMNETSIFHTDLYPKRMQCHAGALGKIIYSEGEYYHDFGPKGLPGYNPKNGKIDGNGWRKALPPMWYPTHATAYYVGISRMAGSWDMKNAHGEKGRVYGEKPHDKRISGKRPPLPPSVKGGGHGGSHGQLTNNFIESILLDKKPIVDVSEALNMTMAGVIAHQSALKGGDWMKIPQYDL